MKKLVMRSVRAVLQVIPKTLKDKLKQSERLTDLYVKSVRKSGLFFDAPTPEQTRLLYKKWLATNKTAFTYLKKERGEWQAVIFGEEYQCKTEKHVRDLGAKCCIYINPKCSGSINDKLVNLDDSTPTILLNAGDVLEAAAIPILLDAMEDSDAVYCDTDVLDDNSITVTPRFLPAWNPELLYSTAYINSGVMIKTSLLKISSIAVDSSIPEIMTQLSLVNSRFFVKHLPLPLLHQAHCPEDGREHLSKVKRAIERHSEAKVLLDETFNVNRVCWGNSNPLVSLIIPTKNKKELVKACIESILEKTTYQNYEILLVDNGSDERRSIEYFSYLNTLDKVKVLKYPSPFNYSAINNFGVRHANGSVIGLINNDIEVITPDWLTHMVGHVLRDSVGCVGAKLLYSDTRIQHAGVVLGYGGGAGHAHKNFPRHHSGYLKRITATNSFSAVTAACLLVKRKHFEAVGGLEEKALSVAFNDVDFCLKVKSLGVNNVYCAEAELFHHESVSRGLDVSPEKAARFKSELAYLQKTWRHVIENDPAYSPNLTLKRENFSIKSRDEVD